MKTLSSVLLLLLLSTILSAQINRNEVLQDLEKQRKNAPTNPVVLTCTLNSASRLFGEKEDLTNVIGIIPAGTILEITGSDSTYYKVIWEESEGFIYKKHATMNEAQSVSSQKEKENESIQTIQSPQQGEAQPLSRRAYLEKRYGTTMASKLMAGKIWKGMTARMVRDSWGEPVRIRSLDNNSKQEWSYTNTWLIIENNTLVEWGPVIK